MRKIVLKHVRPPENKQRFLVSDKLGRSLSGVSQIGMRKVELLKAVSKGSGKTQVFVLGAVAWLGINPVVQESATRVRRAAPYGPSSYITVTADGALLQPPESVVGRESLCRDRWCVGLWRQCVGHIEQCICVYKQCAYRLIALLQVQCVQIFRVKRLDRVSLSVLLIFNLCTDHS